MKERPSAEDTRWRRSIGRSRSFGDAKGRRVDWIETAISIADGPAVVGALRWRRPGRAR